jgi:benzoyl-CoA reductase/2-hydroxyglutaryl-CoA dehydratase subunit BcrC/BadD/HgdB
MEILNSQLNRKLQLKRLLQITKEEGVSKKSPFYTLKASHKRVQVIANLFRRAYRQDSKVVYRSVIMPTEIFFAMDLLPVCLETVCAMLASSNLSSRLLNIAEQHHYSRDICSFTRCTLGAAIEDYLPTPDFLACTSYYCDDTTKLFYILSKMYKKEFFLLDIPYDYKNGDSIKYLTEQLIEMTKKIEKVFDRKLDPFRLQEAIRLSNEARAYFVKINELRTHIPTPISGGEAIDYAALLAFTWGSKEMVEVCKSLYEELSEIVGKGIVKKEERLRILWRHLRPYYSDALINFIENELNATIAFEEINYIHWDEMDPKDPFRSLAKKLILNSPVGPIEHWMKDSLGLIEKYQIDAVISFTHWGCRQLGSTNQIFKEELSKRSIPMLELGGDCIDPREFSFQQLKTRIEAFLEMIMKRFPVKTTTLEKMALRQPKIKT